MFTHCWNPAGSLQEADTQVTHWREKRNILTHSLQKSWREKGNISTTFSPKELERKRKYSNTFSPKEITHCWKPRGIPSGGRDTDHWIIGEKKEYSNNLSNKREKKLFTHRWNPAGCGRTHDHWITFSPKEKRVGDEKEIIQLHSLQKREKMAGDEKEILQLRSLQKREKMAGDKSRKCRSG